MKTHFAMTDQQHHAELKRMFQEILVDVQELGTTLLKMRESLRGIAQNLEAMEAKGTNTDGQTPKDIKPWKR